MSQSPEIAAFKALAVTGDMRVISEGDHDIYMSVGRDTTMFLERKGADARDEPDPAALWILQFEFEVQPGRLPTDLDALKGKLVAALIRVAGVIGKAGSP